MAARNVIVVPDDPYDRRDWLGMMVSRAMAHSDDIAPAAARFSEVVRIAVDVTFGDATDADLRREAAACLDQLHFMADVRPLRACLTALLESIDEPPGADSVHAPEAACSATDNEMPDPFVVQKMPSSSPRPDKPST